MKHGKKYEAVHAKVDRLKEYGAIEAIEFLKANKTAKFDETVEIAVNLGVDARKSDQSVRGAAVLPHGLGKNVRVLAFAAGDKEAEAKEAGVDYVGGDDLAQKIQGGWLEFDAVVATPDMMKVVGKLGKILGTRGLMPNPKVGTVTMDIGKAVAEVKAGKIDFKVDKFGIVHTSIGKVSFAPEKLVENATEFVNTLIKLKPSAAKGTYVKSIFLSSTMSPGIQVEPKSVSEK